MSLVFSGKVVKGFSRTELPPSAVIKHTRLQSCGKNREETEGLLLCKGIKAETVCCFPEGPNIHFDDVCWHFGANLTGNKNKNSERNA